jgi:hexosaminidase
MGKVGLTFSEDCNHYKLLQDLNVNYRPSFNVAYTATYNAAKTTIKLR